MYRYILRESCSQFDSLPLTYLTILSYSSLTATAEESFAPRPRRALRATSK